MRNKIAWLVNSLFGGLGVRVVNKDWGPRGFLPIFREIREKNLSPSVIYDVGSSDGSWSLEAKSVFADADFYLFEPQKSCSAALSELEKRNSKFRHLPFALGSEDCNLLLNVHGGQSSLLDSKEWSAGKDSVIVRTIDNFVSTGTPGPQLLKADIQGFELEMLRGASKALETCPFVFLELSWIPLYSRAPIAAELISYLAERDFHIIDICSYAIRPLDGRLTQSDVLFAHKSTGLFSEQRWGK